MERPDSAFSKEFEAHETPSVDLYFSDDLDPRLNLRNYISQI